MPNPLPLPWDPPPPMRLRIVQSARFTDPLPMHHKIQLAPVPPHASTRASNERQNGLNRATQVLGSLRQSLGAHLHCRSALEDLCRCDARALRSVASQPDVQIPVAAESPPPRRLGWGSVRPTPSRPYSQRILNLLNSSLPNTPPPSLGFGHRCLQSASDLRGKGCRCHSRLRRVDGSAAAAWAPSLLPGCFRPPRAAGGPESTETTQQAHGITDRGGPLRRTPRKWHAIYARTHPLVSEGGNVNGSTSMVTSTRLGRLRIKMGGCLGGACMEPDVMGSHNGRRQHPFRTSFLLMSPHVAFCWLQSHPTVLRVSINRSLRSSRTSRIELQELLLAYSAFSLR